MTTNLVTVLQRYSERFCEFWGNVCEKQISAIFGCNKEKGVCVKGVIKQMDIV